MDNEYNYKQAVDEIARGITYMMGENNMSNTQIYNGVITAINNDIYVIKINGKTYNLTQYGNFNHNVNSVVKVFVPQGNMNMAFFI